MVTSVKSLRALIEHELKVGQQPADVYETAVAKLAKCYTGTLIKEDEIIYITRAVREIERALRDSLPPDK